MPRLPLSLLFLGSFFYAPLTHAQIVYNTLQVTTPSTISGEYAAGSGYWGVSLVDVGPISGEVVLINDGVAPETDGCQSPVASIDGKIALIDRGTCSLVTKPYLAGFAGAIAVILVNNQPGEAPYQGGGYEGQITIPTVIVSQETGDLLKANLSGLEATLQGSELVISTSECTGGTAGPFQCEGVNLEANVPRSVFVTPESAAPRAANDIWGWTDPETGREYALVGLTNGTAFVDVTVPTAPVYLGKLPTETFDSTWRDIKTYADHAFIVSEAGGHGMQVFDLTRLRSATGSPVTFDTDALYTGITSAHNIVINEASGFAYAVGSRSSSGLPAECQVRGFHAIDISTPASPTFGGCFSDVASETGPRSPGYTHDAQCVMYSGPDADYQGREICIASNEDVVSIFDVTDKGNVALISQASYPASVYTHQGWLTADQTYLIVNDEIDEIAFGGLTQTIVFDLFDLDDPVFSFAHSGTSEASDHNLYVHGGRIFQSNYRAGLRILDVSGIENSSLTEIASFDTWPESNDVGTTGQWSNYPYFASGTVVVNDTRGGLFVLSLAAGTRPIADAGDDQTVVVGQTVSLFGSGSPEGGLTFAWSLSGATLYGANTANPTFCAAEPVTYTAELIVNDGSLDSEPDELNVTAVSVNDALDTLADAVGALDGTLNMGQINGLIRKLTSAKRLLDDDKTVETLVVLADFRQQVVDLQAEDELSTAQADVLVDALDTIAEVVVNPCTAAQRADNPVASKRGEVADAFGLAAPYPNPTTGHTTISFSIEEAANVDLSIYDALGRSVAVLVKGAVPAGRHQLTFDGSELVAGIYFVRLTADGRVATNRLTLVR